MSASVADYGPAGCLDIAGSGDGGKTPLIAGDALFAAPVPDATAPYEQVGNTIKIKFKDPPGCVPASPPPRTHTHHPTCKY